MKKLFFGFFGLVIILLTVSCGTTTNVFDKDLPLDQSAVLKMMETITIKSYNGIDVQLKTSSSTFVWPMALVSFIIPAGRATLVMDLSQTSGSTVYMAANVPLTYDFEAGEKYRIYFYFTDADKNLTAYGNIPAIVFAKESDLRTLLLLIQLERRAGTVLE